VPNRLPPLNSLRCFEAAARLESFSRAGDELYLTHGAISRQIKLLEEALGIALFERRNRRVFLTEGGKNLLFATQAAFSRLIEVCDTLRKRSAEPIVLSCEPTLTQRWLIPRLSQLHRDHPDLVVHVLAAGGPVNFERSRVDLAIRRNDFSWSPAIFSELIMMEEVGPVCSPALARKSQQSLLQQTKIHAATRRDAWDKWHVSTNRRPLPGRSLAFEHFFLSIQAAVAGLGVAIGPRPLVLDDLESGSLVAPFGFTASGYGYYLLSQHSFEQDKRAKMLLSWLQKAACNRTRRKKTASRRRT